MQLIEALFDLCNKRPSIIAIDGPAGSGKTTLAGEIKRALHDRSVEIIHMDDLYNGWGDALTPHLTGTLLSLINAQQKQESVKLDIYDWTSRAFTAQRVIEPVDLLILEGVGSGQSATRPLLNALVWVETEEGVGLERVLARDGEAIRNEMMQWQEQQREHFAREKTRESADFELTT